MNILIAGAAGFIGTNLTLALMKNPANHITITDTDTSYFTNETIIAANNVSCLALHTQTHNFEHILENIDLVFHLVSTTNPSSSNNDIEAELNENITFSTRLLEASVKHHVSKIIFISSGGTVYGNVACPITENAPTNPITAYGIQKLTIEKICHLYHCMHGIDYSILRLANPYGPYQRPNGKLGALTTFTYKALHQETLHVYGDGSVVRDYIYIDDAIDAMLKIAFGSPQYHIYNIGSGTGTSLNDLIDHLRSVLDIRIDVNYEKKRSVDLPANYLDITRYETEFGTLVHTPIDDGIRRTADFLKAHS